MNDMDRKEFVSKFGLSLENQMKWLESWAELPKLQLDAEWEISYWKSGEGFSHSEVVNHTVEEEELDPEELKNFLMDWWYENGWNDTEYDGHRWSITYYLDGNLFDHGDYCWIYPEDFN